MFKNFTIDANGTEKTIFTKVGGAIPHKKGEGFNLKITSGISVAGELVVFPPKDNDES